MELKFSSDFNKFLAYARTRGCRISSALIDKRDSVMNVSGSADASYLCVSKDDANLISYLTAERLESMQENVVSDFYNPPNPNDRFKGKPLRIIGRLIIDFDATDITDSNKEYFMNIWKEYYAPQQKQEEDRFDLVVKRNIDINDVYHEDNMWKESGTLGNSCMKDEDRNRFMDAYSDQGDSVVQVLVLYRYNDDGDKLVAGRALLWQKVKTDELGTIKFMDRIYTNKSRDEALFVNWSKENGYYRKEHQSYDYKSSLISPTNEIHRQVIMSVKLRHDLQEGYNPYWDTFTFYDEDGCMVHNAGCGELHSEKQFTLPSAYRMTDHCNGGFGDCLNRTQKCELSNIYYQPSDIVELFRTDKRRKIVRAYRHNYDVIEVRVYEPHTHGSGVECVYRYTNDLSKFISCPTTGRWYLKKQVVLANNTLRYKGSCEQFLGLTGKKEWVYKNDIVTCAHSLKRFPKKYSVLFNDGNTWVSMKHAQDYIEMLKAKAVEVEDNDYIEMLKAKAVEVENNQ
jgi:hypothetical protein